MANSNGNGREVKVREDSAREDNASERNSRDERLQIMLAPEELSALDDFRFKKRMPSRAAAVRELLRRGLAAEGFPTAGAGVKSSEYGVIGKPTNGRGKSA